MFVCTAVSSESQSQSKVDQGPHPILTDLPVNYGRALPISEEEIALINVGSPAVSHFMSCYRGLIVAAWWSKIAFTFFFSLFMPILLCAIKT